MENKAYWYETSFDYGEPGWYFTDQLDRIRGPYYDEQEVQDAVAKSDRLHFE